MNVTALLRRIVFGWVGLGCGIGATAADPVRVLLIDGQNNHAWQETTPVLVDILEKSGRFEVTVSTAPAAPPKPPRMPKDPDEAAKAKFAEEMKAWEAETAARKAESDDAWGQWRPDFSACDVVVSNYNGELWPEAVRTAFDAYVKGGGGFVAVHAADNAFPEWPEYNRMIGVGGWGGRTELSGPYLRKRGGGWTGDLTVGQGGSHGKQHEFVVEIQMPDHPVTRGLPAKWLHAQDELYDRLRGPAEQVTVLAAAFSDKATGGSGEWEPLLMAIDYGKGRVFHTALGHSVVSMAGLGFQETLKRGTEWAATGEVTFPAVDAGLLPLDRAGVAAP